MQAGRAKFEPPTPEQYARVNRASSRNDGADHPTPNRAGDGFAVAFGVVLALNECPRKARWILKTGHQKNVLDALSLLTAGSEVI